MSDLENYQRAKSRLERIPDKTNGTNAVANATVANAYATLALVEQQAETNKLLTNIYGALRRRNSV